MRISDWSSDVCSSDLIAVATRLPALPTASNPHPRRPSAPNRVRSGPSRRQSPPRWQHLYVAPTPRPPKAEMARAVLYQPVRSEEHTSELQSLMRISYAVFCLKKKNYNKHKLIICVCFDTR